jgi:hypothetical protein
MNLLRLIVFLMAPGSVTCIMKVLFTDYILPIFEQEKSHQFNLPRLILHKELLDRENSVGSLSLTYQYEIRAGKNRFSIIQQIRWSHVTEGSIYSFHFSNISSWRLNRQSNFSYPSNRPSEFHLHFDLKYGSTASWLYNIMWLSFILSL